MKKFTFELATLLTIRTREEERIMRELAEKNRQILDQQNVLDRTAEELRELQASERKRRSEQESVMELRYSVAYRYKLKADLLNIGRGIQGLQAEAEEIRIRLTRATQAKKALEMVKAKKLAAWKKEATRKEQNFIDDVAQQRYIANGR